MIKLLKGKKGKFRRLAASVLTLALLVAVFSGCSGMERDDEYADDTSSSDSGTSDYNYEATSDDSADSDFGYAEEEYEQPQQIDISGESYDEILENDFITTGLESVSTFSIDVDTAAYANIRDMIFHGQVPPADAVRIEEMINYFEYEYARPTENEVVSVETAISPCPWNDNAQLMLIGMQGYEIPTGELPDSNIVFLLDVSGSMNDPDKLPLLVDSFEILIEQFDRNDRISVVVYAGASGVVLDGERGSHHDEIIEALNSLTAGGSTAGSAGIELAYELAEEYFIEDGNNRVILATDGDFNVGLTSQEALEDLIADKRETGIFLSVLGFGRGNYADDIAETLADKGNGNYSYIDSIEEAYKVFDKEFAGTIYTVAKDVKIQVEFNNNVVYAYKLVGYENRVMDNEDFDDDTKDAGELGSGHTVTALYEIILHEDVAFDEHQLFSTVDVRYKDPDEDDSKWISFNVTTDELSEELVDNRNMLWAASVAEFGMVLRNEAYIDFGTVNDIIERLEENFGIISDPYKLEFIDMMEYYTELVD